MKTISVGITLAALAASALITASISGKAASSIKTSSLQSCRQSGLGGAECECQIALSVGTKNALQSFLRRNPHADTACNATASTNTGISIDFPPNSTSPLPGSSSSSSGGSTSSSSSGGSSGAGQNHDHDNDGDKDRGLIFAH